MKDHISDLLKLAVAHETITSVFEKQSVKMKAGKVRKQLKALNDESIKQRSGIKMEN